MAVYTGGSTSVVYGYETDYGDGASNALTNIFGLQQKVSSFSLTTNRIDLNKLGQVEPTAFAYGQQQGTLSLGFVFEDGDSYKIFESLYGSPSTATGVHTHPANATTPFSHSTSPSSPTTLTTQISLQTNANTNINEKRLVRTLKGCVVNSIGISTSIGETVNGSVDMTFGKEDTANVGVTGSITQQDDASFDQAGTPYTFAHGELLVNTGAGLTEVATVQDVDVTLAQNSELLYGLGQNYAKDVFRRVFDISGRFRATWQDDGMINHVIKQASETPDETLSDVSGVGMSLTFESGTKSIKLEFGGVSITDHNVSGIEPVEPVFEEINWKAKASRVVIDTT